MRFVHTADWHLGKKLRGRSRLAEQRAALQQIHAAAKAHAVDAVLVAGDLFDSTMPPPEAEQVAFEFFAQLSRAGIQGVVIAGNHDHPQRLAALQPLLESLHLHVRAEVRPPDAGGVIELRSRDGKETALIAALPFVAETKVLDALMVASGTHQGHEEYRRRIAEALRLLTQPFRADTINLVVAHLLVSGAKFGTGERQLHLGEIFAVQPDDLPAAAGYVALGHLHRPQEIRGPVRAAYSGSLVELDFGEREQDKRAVLIEARAGLPVQLSDIPLTAGRRLRDLRGTLAQLAQQRDSVAGAFVRAVVLVPEPSPGIEDKVRALLPDAVDVRQEWPRTEVAPAAVAPAGARTPAELFAAFHQREQGTPPPAALAQLFDELHHQAQREQPAP